MICHCSLAGTAACSRCASNINNTGGGTLEDWVMPQPPNFPPPRTKKITTEEYDKDGKLVKRVIEEG